MALTLTVAALAAAWTPPAVRALGGDGLAQVSRGRYVVRTGDTLWSIALRVSPGEDPRPVVDAISAANSIEAGSLVPGQTLVIPTAR
jgi:nucleoid-associated protein YgaU